MVKTNRCGGTGTIYQGDGVFHGVCSCDACSVDSEEEGSTCPTCSRWYPTPMSEYHDTEACKDAPDDIIRGIQADEEELRVAERLLTEGEWNKMRSCFSWRTRAIMAERELSAIRARP